MGAPQDSRAGGTVVDLAVRAQEAIRGLCYQAYGVHERSGIDSPAEIQQVLASLRELVDNVANSLPALNAWLEQRLWSGTLLDTPDVEAFDGLTRSMHDTATALARARMTSTQLGQELRTAYIASRGLTPAP